MSATPARQPVLFVGHGSPMNAVADNSYTRTLNSLGVELIATPPRAILCVSAHWATTGEGVFVTAMKKPRTIHDFFGFPSELFSIQYPAIGSPEWANRICKQVDEPQIDQDQEWGLDHGTWSVLRHMFPHAEIPVLQLSLDLARPPEFHLQLALKLRPLRDEGLLIVGSGDVVHNLRQIQWQESAPPYPWAIDFDRAVSEKLEQRDFEGIARDLLPSRIGQLSAPTPEHFFPLFYTTGASFDEEAVRFEYTGIQNASISMLTFSFGR